MHSRFRLRLSIARPGPGPTGALGFPFATLLYNAEMVRIVWEFRVRQGREEEFELFYNGEGLWAMLFRRSPAYFGTKLLRDIGAPGRYITVDKWENSFDFDLFKQEFQLEYNAIDAKCEELTQEEKLVGVFEEI
jgi:hypothetical protein